MQQDCKRYLDSKLEINVFKRINTASFSEAQSQHPYHKQHSQSSKTPNKALRARSVIGSKHSSHALTHHNTSTSSTHSSNIQVMHPVRVQLIQKTTGANHELNTKMVKPRNSLIISKNGIDTIGQPPLHK